MKFSSIMNDIINRFASIDIVIEPEESAVREAVNKLKGSNPKYFDGVKKIVVEHGNPKSPYLGKATGENIIYISLDAIKNQLDGSGNGGDRQAFVNEVLKTIGHEVAHIRGDMAHTEAPSEAEELKLEQQFPTPGMEKSAAELTPEQKKSLQLQKEIREFQEKLNQLQVVWQQISKPSSHGVTEKSWAPDPAKEAHFRAEQGRLSAEIASRREQLQALRGEAVAEQGVNVAPNLSAPLMQPKAISDDAAKYKSIFEQISSPLSSAISVFSNLEKTLSGAPDFVRGEKGVLFAIKRVVSELETINKKLISRVAVAETAPHLFAPKAVELLFSDINDALLSAQDLLKSNDNFINPLTNQGRETEFYTTAVLPLVAEINGFLASAASLAGLQYKQLLQVPDAAPVPEQRSEPAAPSKSSDEAPQSAPRVQPERDLKQIQMDYAEELGELFDKRDALRKLHIQSAGISDPKLYSALAKKKDDLESSLSVLEGQRSDWIIRKEMISGNYTREEWVAEGQRLEEEIQRVNSDLASASAQLEQMGASATSGLDKDQLAEVIYPYASEDSFNRRIELVSDKIMKFRELDKFEKELESTIAEISIKENDPAASKPELKNLKRKRYELNTRISDLKKELGSSSTPRPKKDQPERARVVDTIDASVENISSPLAKKLFQNIIPSVSSGGALKSKKMDLQRKLRYRTEGGDPETDYDNLSGSIPADVEILKWKSSIGDIDREIAFRQSDAMLNFAGRIGLAAEALVAQMMGDESAVVPKDILGPDLTLKNYSGNAGNDKIIRDLQSALNINAKAVAELKKAFDRVTSDIAKAKEMWEKAKYAKAPNVDQLRSDLDKLVTRQKMLVGSKEYKKVQTDLAAAVDRIVQHAMPVSKEMPIARKVVRERGEQSKTQPLGRIEEQRQVAKELGIQVDPEVELAQMVSPEAARNLKREEELRRIEKEEQGAKPDESDPLQKRVKQLSRQLKEKGPGSVYFEHIVPQEMKGHEQLGEVGLGEYEEGGPISFAPIWQGQEWLAGEPLGRFNLLDATKADVRQGLYDPSVLPSDVKKDLLTRLQRGSEELRELKGRLSSPDMTPASKTRVMDRVSKVRQEIDKIRDLLKNPIEYLTDAKDIESRLEKQLEFQDNLTAEVYSRSQEKEQVEAAIAAAGDEEKPALQRRLNELEAFLSGAAQAEEFTAKRVSQLEARLKAAREAGGRLPAGVMPGASFFESPEVQKLKSERKVGRESLRTQISEKESELSRLQSEANRLGADAPDELKSEIEVLKEELSKLRLSTKREFIPPEEDKEYARKHRERFEKALDKSDAERAERYRERDRKTKVAMARRRSFIDPTNPTKQLPSTRLLNAARRMAWSYAKALEINPKKDESRETMARDILYQMTALDNSIRMLDDEILIKATENAEKASADPMEQFRIRNELMNKEFDSQDYKSKKAKMETLMEALKEASIIKAPSGRGLIESIVEERDMGKGVGKVRPIEQKWVGHQDPYVLFMMAAWEARTAYTRLSEASKARKKIDKKFAADMEAARKSGATQKEMDKLRQEYELIVGSISAQQIDEIDQFNELVNKLDGSVRGTAPTVYFNPKNVQSYIDEYKQKQAELVRQKELLRRHIQVMEIGTVTSYTYDPDRFMKSMLKEFSDDMPTVSKWQEMASAGSPEYKDLAYVQKHLLLGQKVKGRKKKDSSGKTVAVPPEVGSPREQLVTERIRHKEFPAPVRPGGKGQRGDKIPQHMQVRSRN